MADHVFHAVVDHFVGDCNGLFRVAGIVVFDRFKLFAIDAAFGVDLLDGHFGTVELHGAVLGNWAGFRAGDADLDGVSCERMAGNPRHNQCGKQP